jgi:hypothetical protein
MTLSKLPLSGSTNGKAIKVAATASPGTAVHTAVASTTDKDEIWLYAYNGDTVNRDLTIEYGGTTVPDNVIVQTIPPKSGVVLVVPGLVLQNALAVAAFASSANVITVLGFVNRIAG